MDQAALIYVLLAVVVILPFVGVFLKRKGRRAGAERWDAKKDRQASEGGLGATLTLGADEATARTIVAPILEAAKRVRLQDDGTWAQTHYNTDDVVYALQAAPGGSTLAVSRAIEFAGTLNGVKAWRRLREQIVAEAIGRGITVEEGTRELARSQETNESGALVWLPL